MTQFPVVKKPVKKTIKERRINLAISLPPPDSSFILPFLNLHSAMSSSSSSSSIKLSDLDQDGTIDVGGSSTVYRVRHHVTGQPYALKIIHRTLEESIRIQITSEINILREIDSPFIVCCHGIFEQGGNVKILLEYMDGGNIGSLGRIAEQTLSKFARQILLGLAYLHGKRIVHGDIKPMNILIKGQDQVKICDFGFSQILTGETSICTSPDGTFAYMSPEQFEEGPYDGYASDIWSFGMSVLECHMGKHPLKRPKEDLRQWTTCAMYAIQYVEPPEMPDDASEDFQSFVQCCMRKEPSDRWTAEQLLEHPFIITHRENSNAQDLIDQNPPEASSSSSNTAQNPQAASSSSSNTAQNPYAASSSSSNPSH